jgi:hypothetical protein
MVSDENSTCRLTNGQNEAFMNINDNSTNQTINFDNKKN